MPIYEYECQKCGHRVEKMQGINDKPLSRCPKCKGKLEKQWSQTSFQLKGSGWYVTDYAAKKTETKSDGEAKTDAKDDKSDKPAAAEAGESSKSTDDKKANEPAKPASTEPKVKGKKSSTKSAD